MTLNTSEVAVCCSNDSVRSSVRCRNSLSSRVFSIAMAACAAKVAVWPLGVPEIRPVESIASPAGSAPDVVDHVIAPVPPVAASACE